MAVFRAWEEIERIAGSRSLSAWRRQTHPTQSYVLTRNGVHNIIGWGTQKFSDDGELVNMILPGEQGLALQHLGENTSRAPDINLDIILLPCEHNLWGPVVSRRDITSHLWVLDTCQAKVADFQITVLVHENVARLQITMNNTCRMNVFQTTLERVSHGPPIGLDMHTRIW